MPPWWGSTAFIEPMPKSKSRWGCNVANLCVSTWQNSMIINRRSRTAIRGWKMENRERRSPAGVRFVAGATNAKLKSVSPDGDEGVTMIVGSKASSSAMGNFKSTTRVKGRVRYKYKTLSDNTNLKAQGWAYSQDAEEGDEFLCLEHSVSLSHFKDKLISSSYRAWKTVGRDNV